MLAETETMTHEKNRGFPVTGGSTQTLHITPLAERDAGMQTLYPSRGLERNACFPIAEDFRSARWLPHWLDALELGLSARGSARATAKPRRVARLKYLTRSRVHRVAMGRCMGSVSTMSEKHPSIWGDQGRAADLSWKIPELPTLF